MNPAAPRATNQRQPPFQCKCKSILPFQQYPFLLHLHLDLRVVSKFDIMAPKQPSLLTQRLTTDQLLARNREYSHGHIPAPTKEQAIAAAGGSRLPVPIIVSCFDARIIPDQFFDLAPGEATVLRNIGGRVNDHMLLQIAALGVLRPLGDILIIHHEGKLLQTSKCAPESVD